MPFIPHTEKDTQEMLQAIDVSNIETLFDEIPTHIRAKPFINIRNSINEMDMLRLMQARADKDQVALNFIGAGAYEHHIPAAVWDITTRGELMTSYTPYQAEASQGTLQLLYEYQTMIANLTGMEASNASLYDGASALGEAILMAVRLHKSNETPKILIPNTIHPHYLETAKTLVQAQGIEIVTISMSSDGHIDPTILEKYHTENISALVIPQPNFFGILEEVDVLTDWAHAHQALVIAVVNPLSLALLKEPGQWGQEGADIVCGELQPFGIPLSSGGPYAGFMSCKAKHVRQMPGRIIGKTTDKDGKCGFTLTLQAREQHIRRGKATSNICTNQGLLVTAATIYMTLLGFDGLKHVATRCHQNTKRLLEKLLALPNVTQIFTRPYFHEIVIRFDKDINIILEKLAENNILGGLSLERYFSELENCLLICVTETKTEEDINHFIDTLKAILR